MNNKYLTNVKDTIIALSTPFGKSGIGIIRISGSLSKSVSKIFFKKITKHRVATLSTFINPDNNEELDNGILIFFKSPNSYTGEDILEFHGHGNPTLLINLINIIIFKLDIRLAYPGEFSSRAFIKNKLSLSQIEGMFNLIESESILLSKLSFKTLQGLLNNEVNYIFKKIDRLHMLIETYINFSEYDIDEKYIYKKIKLNKLILINKLKKIIYNYNTSKIIFNGIKISIIGKTNVGKSTLFNALINKNKSIISSIEGTTRDVVNESIWINGICFNINDTAGIKKIDNELDNLSIKKTIDEIYNTDHILYVTDNLCNNFNIDYFIDENISNFIDINFMKKIPFTIIKNKSDLSNDKSQILKLDNFKVIYVSAKNKNGINLIIDHFKSFISNDIENINYIVNHKQIEIIYKFLKFLIEFDDSDMLIFVNELKFIKKNILESFVYKSKLSDNILDDIFSKFCIGK